MTKELIERFFRQECSPEERERVLAYFEKNPDLLAEAFDEKEFDEFDLPAEMDKQVSDNIISNVRRNTIQKSRRIRFMYKLSAAASVLLVFGAIWIYSGKEPSSEAITAIQGSGDDPQQIAVITRHESNYTGMNKTIRLEDGSLIILSNNSEIDYQTPFTADRHIHLTGKALFKVAKDKTRPFIVSSGGITTTALGTEFTVSSFKGAKQTIVRLYEGRVVIKAVNKADKRMKEDVYLTPGQEFIYGVQASMATVSAFNREVAGEPAMASEIEQPKDDPSLPQQISGSWFQFNNRPVSEVFDQLAEIYRVHITYDKKNVKNLYFIGKYNSSDSVEVILKRIASLNNLSVNKDNDTTFSIK